MRRSITDGRPYRLALILLAALGARGAFAQLPLSGPARLVNVIEVNDHEDQVDLTMVFNCSMRFITSLPASEGKQVHIQLAPMPDCGVSQLSQLLAETPPVSGGANILTAARVDSMAPGQITVTLDFKKNERFVIAQGVDPRGLRLRLIDRARGRGKILVGQATRSPSRSRRRTWSWRTSGSRRPRSSPRRWSTARSGIGCAWVRSSAARKRTAC
jgi:hypothetical protein